MNHMIAFCGLICTECPAYKATQADDDAARARVAEVWAEAFNAEGLTAEDINCDGCLVNEGRLFSHCFECPIRACGRARGVVNCAHCADYESCEHVAGFFEMAPEAKAVLDEIRAGL